MDILELDAVGQAEAIRSGQVSPAELRAAALTRLRESDALLNSVVWFADENEQDLPDDPAADPGSAPFAGVPIVLKDLPAWQRGVPVGLGVRVLESADIRATEDSPGGARLRAAGFVTVATTSTAPFGWGPWAATGRGHTRTPYDPSRASNGSSGGSAASVAAGAVAVGTGADAAGSIRLPAAWCGVVGHKPTRGLVPSAWAHPQATEGVLTRSVRDAAALLDVLSEPEPGSTFTATRASGGYAAALARPLRPMRIAVLGEFSDATTTTTRDVVTQVGERLADLGHHVDVATPAGLYDEDPDDEAGRAIHAMLAHSIAEAGQLLGRPLRENEIEPYVAMLGQAGEAASARQELRRVAAMQSWSRALCRFWADYDVLVCPTSPFPPLPVDEWEPNLEDPMEPWMRWGPGLDYTEPFNRTGQPALSIPAAVVDGLPYAVQLVGRHDEDAVLLQLAAALEVQPNVPRWPVHGTD
ncbi:MAG: amidase [Actinomycetota bacterium]|nr:amidase [Actinomycetota bacterium]